MKGLFERLKAYGLIAINTLKEEMTYSQNAVMDIIFSFFGIMFQIIIWSALYASNGNQPVMGRALSDMLTYTIIASIVRAITSGGSLSDSAQEKMKSGEIALDYLRPVSPRGMLIAATWGSKLQYVISQSLPVAAAVLMVGGIGFPGSIGQLALFLLSMLLGYMISLMLELLMATFAFWFVSTRTLGWFISFFELAMSGSIVPLWLLPGWLKGIAQALPFQAVNYIPVTIYMGGMSAAEFYGAIALQIAWIGGLWAVQEIMWRRGIRRIVVHGG
ncbi:MAG: ABC transporter permease [Christensenellales bacterium]|jgi:ABC-2 type transport system permease protein